MRATCELLGGVGSGSSPDLRMGSGSRAQEAVGLCVSYSARGAALGNDNQITSPGGDQREDVINYKALPECELTPSSWRSPTSQEPAEPLARRCLAQPAASVRPSHLLLLRSRGANGAPQRPPRTCGCFSSSQP